jgi:hypothetical protein
MTDNKICQWLTEKADAPIRYRVYREFLNKADDAKTMENELLQHPEVIRWLKNLKPDLTQRDLYHGSFDTKFENAMLKVIQLGLHSEIKEVKDAAGFYIDDFGKYDPDPKRSIRIHSNFLAAVGFIDNFIVDYLLQSLDILNSFIKRDSYNIYLSDSEKSKLKGVPTRWKKDKKFIRPEMTKEYGFCYPLIYDLVGLSKLYELHNKDVDTKIDNVIKYIACDEYHDLIQDGYGIVTVDGNYYGMGWDARFPGWHNIKYYMENEFHSKLLFFATVISEYPVAVQTVWFKELLEYLEKYKTVDGTYCFPDKWFVERTGYFVSGSHTSFGENRRKKDWREIESTFYMQLLLKNV